MGLEILAGSAPFQKKLVDGIVVGLTRIQHDQLMCDVVIVKNAGGAELVHYLHGDGSGQEYQFTATSGGGFLMSNTRMPINNNFKSLESIFAQMARILTDAYYEWEAIQEN